MYRRKKHLMLCWDRGQPPSSPPSDVRALRLKHGATKRTREKDACGLGGGVREVCRHFLCARTLDPQQHCHHPSSRPSVLSIFFRSCCSCSAFSLLNSNASCSFLCPRNGRACACWQRSVAVASQGADRERAVAVDQCGRHFKVWQHTPYVSTERHMLDT